MAAAVQRGQASRPELTPIEQNTPGGSGRIRRSKEGRSLLPAGGWSLTVCQLEHSIGAVHNANNYHQNSALPSRPRIESLFLRGWHPRLVNQRFRCETGGDQYYPCKNIKPISRL
jgi:hypothetical protein